jgi:putative endonuclease
VAGSIPAGPTKNHHRWFFLYMPAVCYILYSSSIDKFYTGTTHLDMDTRLSNHLRHKYEGGHFTHQANDWEIFLEIEVPDFAHAVRLERKIKSMKSSKYIRNLKQYPELLEKIIKETSDV